MGSEGVKELLSIAPVQTKIKDSPETVLGECHTPKSNDHRIKPVLVCPPAPKKQPPIKRKLMPPQQGFFVVPCDLSSIFIPIPTPPVKKIRAG
ncbi:hypothetical protein MRB53_022262 [Persea americana]|uniref:Uncharacterized protein n=1 Tax=Persea americana TaxID=3435 RepID=A0ACC2L690_PERAE|nr:hypothetical protein MRB53_022262 [Persea americana]